MPRPDQRAREGKPESFGYMRASHHDTAGEIAFERPDGTIALFPRQPGTSPNIWLGRRLRIADLKTAREWSPHAQS